MFQEALLARGLLTVRGRRVDPRAIRRTALLTVEGERDDICSVGQTMAAHDLCTSLRPYLKRHHLQPGAGHYGVFSGTRWETRIYPVVRNFVLASDQADMRPCAFSRKPSSDLPWTPSGSSFCQRFDQ